MGKYRSRISGSNGKNSKTSEDFFIRKLIARKHKADREFNMAMAEGNSAEYEKIKSMSVVDYLTKVDKFTFETEIKIREVQRLKAKQHGKRR